MKATREELMAKLDALGIAVAVHDHPAVFTVEEADEHTGHLPGGHCKNLFLKDKKKQLWLFVCEGDRPVNMKALGEQIGSAKLSFGKPDLLEDVLGVTPGSVTPFALINDTEQQVRVVLDAKMLEHELLNYHPLTNEATIAVKRDDLLTFVRACGHEPMILQAPESQLG